MCKRAIIASALLSSVIVGSSCGSLSAADVVRKNSTQSKDLNNYIQSLGELKQPKESPYTSKGSEKEETISGHICRSKKYAGYPGFNTFLFSRSNIDVMYPGALLSGQSVKDKSYSPSTIRPGPLTLTVNLQGIEGPISKTVENPAFSTVQTTIHDILSQKVAGDAGAEMSWSVENIYSASHLKASLGIDVKVAEIFGAKQNLGLDFSQKTNKAIVKFNQKYYDVVIDVPRTPADFISSDFSIEDAKNSFESVSPVYVSNVSYGRYVLFVFESSDLSMNLEQELTASLNIPVDGVPVKVGGSEKLDTGFKSGQIKSQAFILGGSGERASKAIAGVKEIHEFIRTGGRYSKDSPGRPVSYNLRYLSNNKPVEIVHATNFQKVECSKIFNEYRIRAVSFNLERNRKLSLPQIDLRGAISAGVGGVEIGGKKFSLWAQKWNIGKYPIRVDQKERNIGSAPVSLSFSRLTPQERKKAYIDLEMNVKGGWAGIFEDFYPKRKTIFLNELVPGEFKVTLNTQWHDLEITFNIEGIE